MLNNAEVVQATAIRSELARKLAQIGATQGITRREADRRKAQAVLAAREEMRELRAGSNDRSSEEAAKSYKACFGIRPDRSAEDRAYRDSLAAQELSATDASRLMAQAIMRGDELAQTALAEYAWNAHHDPVSGKSFIPVLESYADAGYGDALNALASLSEPSKIDRFTDKVATEISQPSDLPGNLDYLARDDEPTEGARSIGTSWIA